MTFVSARAGNTRTHAFLDEAGHGVWPYWVGSSIPLPQLPYALLSTLASHPYDTLIEYETIARAMWAIEVPTPYDGSFNDMIQNHLKTLRTIMTLYGGWHGNTFRVIYGHGIRVNSHQLPHRYR